ncbi:hypothetical protein [Amnibacterium kyonggiense]
MELRGYPGRVLQHDGRLVRFDSDEDDGLSGVGHVMAPDARG